MLHESIHDEVVSKLTKAYAQVRIGDPMEGVYIYIYLSKCCVYCEMSQFGSARIHWIVDRCSKNVYAHAGLLKYTCYL